MTEAGTIEAQLRQAGMSAGAAASKAATFLRLEQAAGARGSGERWRAWFVPGRVELLGKHTDYAGGRSLLCALERGFCVMARPRSEARLWLQDVDWRSEAEFGLGEAAPAGLSWANYPAVVGRRLQRDFPELGRGVEMVFSSDLPRAAGMSSSSALMVATYLALEAGNRLASLERYQARIRSREELAGYLAAMESGQSWGDFPGDGGVGTQGGSEDHTAILCCRAGQWSQYDFSGPRGREALPEAMLAAPAGYAMVIGVSGVAAAKTGAAGAAYNRAAGAARAILRVWNEQNGAADASLGGALARVRGAAEGLRAALRELGERDGFSGAELRARLEQFLAESEVIIPAVNAAVRQGSWEELGTWVARSQQGAETGLRNQTPETVALVEAARRLGAVAASGFGAGFGGAVWALAPLGRGQEFRRAWQVDYRQRFAQRASSSQFFLSGAGPAALELKLAPAGRGAGVRGAGVRGAGVRGDGQAKSA